MKLKIVSLILISVLFISTLTVSAYAATSTSNYTQFEYEYGSIWFGDLTSHVDSKLFFFNYNGNYYWFCFYFDGSNYIGSRDILRYYENHGSSGYKASSSYSTNYGSVYFFRYAISSLDADSYNNYVTINNPLLTQVGVLNAIGDKLNGFDNDDVSCSLFEPEIPLFTGENSIWNNGIKLIKGFNTKSEFNTATGDFSFTLDFDDELSDGSAPDPSSSYYQYAFAGYDEDNDSLSIWEILTNPTKAINFVLKHHDDNGYLEIDTTGGGGHSFGPSDGFNWKKYIPKILTRRVYWNEEEQEYQNTNWYEVTINDNSIGTQVVQNISQTTVNDITYNQNLYNTTTQSYYYDYSVGQVINNYSEKIITNNYYTENVYTYTTVYNTNNNQTFNDAHNITYNSVLVTPDLDFGDLFGDDSSGFDWSSISIEKIIKAIGTLLSGLLVMIPMMFELLGFLPAWAVTFMVTGVTIMIALAVVYLILRGIKN